MMNTKAHHTRFWKSMTERFGARFIADYGKEPTKAWIDMLDRYTPDAIAAALDMLSNRREQERAHPPTHAEFDALLNKAAQVLARSDPRDHVRGFWRSVIAAAIVRHAVLLNILPRGTTDIQALRQACEPAYLAALRTGADLLDWACATEREQGQRTPGLEQRINTDLWKVLKIWQRDSAPPDPNFQLTSDQRRELPACSS